MVAVLRRLGLRPPILPLSRLQAAGRLLPHIVYDEPPPGCLDELETEGRRVTPCGSAYPPNLGVVELVPRAWEVTR